MDFNRVSFVALIIGLFIFWLHFVQNGYKWVDIISYGLLVIISTLLLIIIGVIGFFRITQH